METKHWNGWKLKHRQKSGNTADAVGGEEEWELLVRYASLFPSWNIPLFSLTFTFEKESQNELNKQLIRKRKQYFLNILYQKVKFWYGLFSRLFDFLLSQWTIRNSEIWLQILDTRSSTLLLTNLQCALHRSTEADNMQLILDKHR